MIDLHTHTLLSDGALCPAEHIRRAEVEGYRVLGMSDHADLATIARIVPVLLEAARRETERGHMTVLAGIELTHVRPDHMKEAAALAREAGAQYVIAHGETLAEPVEPGTNRAAIEAGVDILAHPGLISPEEAELAAGRNVLLEISAKNGHALANGHVAVRAREAGARLVFGSDAHGPGQYAPRPHAVNVLRGAGLSPEESEAVLVFAERFAEQRGYQTRMDRVADW